MTPTIWCLRRWVKNLIEMQKKIIANYNCQSGHVLFSLINEIHSLHAASIPLGPQGLTQKVEQGQGRLLLCFLFWFAGMSRPIVEKKKHKTMTVYEAVPNYILFYRLPRFSGLHVGQNTERNGLAFNRGICRLLGYSIAIYWESGMSGKLWLVCKRAKCN